MKFLSFQVRFTLRIGYEMVTTWEHHASKAPQNKHKIQIRPIHDRLIRISNHLSDENVQA